MTRLVPVTVLMAILAASRVASAEDPTGPLASGASITFSELKIHEDNNANAEFPKTDPDSIWNYFNLAHCKCGEPGAAPTVTFNEKAFTYLLKLENANGASVDRPFEVWVGPDCNLDAARASGTATCRPLQGAGARSVDQLINPGDFRLEIPVFDFMTPAPGSTKCSEVDQSSSVWVAVDTGGAATLDYFVSKSIPTDSQPPDVPSEFRAIGGDKSIEISWKAPASASDTYGYQALCARASDNSPGKTAGRPGRRYATARTLCGLDSIELVGVDIPTPDNAPTPEPVTDLPDALKNLDETFLCGENISTTATGLRIEGLENEVPYKVVLLAVDQFQNPVGRYFTSTITPVPSTDFWEDLNERDDGIEGGLCLLSETYGDSGGLTNTLRAFRDNTLGGSRVGRWLADGYYATLARLGVYVHSSIALRVVAAIVLLPVVAFALLWHWITLPGTIALFLAVWGCRRHRVVRRMGHRLLPILRRRALHVAVGLLVLAVFAGRVHADGGYRPYWEDNDPTANEQPLLDEPGLVKWHVGVRAGPFIPDIDKQFSMSPGPYEQMFGGFRVLPMLDVDRFFLWTRYGALGAGISLGYMQKSARAFTDGSSPSEPNRERAVDRNFFRMIPAELTATFRFTMLDDEYGIPVVPYVRGGLAYYLWWISVANGDLAAVCKNGGMPPCDQDKALGGSLGLKGAIGLAIRAERIDSATALSMRASGIQHAGIYGELSLAKVDGFGSDSKLSVGDATWFAGVNFEF